MRATVNFIGIVKVACAGEGTIGIGNVNAVLGSVCLPCEQHAITGGEGYPVNFRGSVLHVDIGKGDHAGSGARGKRINIFLGGGVFGLGDRALKVYFTIEDRPVIIEDNLAAAEQCEIIPELNVMATESNTIDIEINTMTIKD